jgi:hypothetical protein
MDRFKNDNYIANTGIVVGFYGGVGYYDLTPIKKEKKNKIKNSFKFFDFFFKKKCACGC